MINEEKVRFMTKCAIYEQGEGKEEIPLATYFKTDYIRLQGLKTVLFATFACVIIAIVLLAYNIDEIYKLMNRSNYTSLFVKLGIVIAVLVVMYYLIASIVYGKRFEKARENVKEYYYNLHCLEEIYEQEADKRPTIFEEEGGVSFHDEFIDY